MRIDVTRRSVLLGVLGVLCFSAPALDVSARMDDGARLVARTIARECWVAREAAGVVVRVESIESSLSTCQAVVRAGTPQGWSDVGRPTRTDRMKPSCRMTRGTSAWAATATVYGDGDGATCAEMTAEGWNLIPVRRAD